MPRYQQYGELDDQPVEQQDLGFFGYNNRNRPDLLEAGLLQTSVNGQIDKQGQWSIRKGLSIKSTPLATSGSAILLNTSSAVLPFTLDDTAVNFIYASCSFSDPKTNIQEVVNFSDETNTDLIVLATNVKAVIVNVRDGSSDDVDYPPSYSVSKKGTALQSFDKVFIFQDGVRSIEWDGILTAITAGSFVVGKTYTIVTAGTTDFTTIGAANNDVGTVFTATGVGTGDGTAKSGFTQVPIGAYPSLVLYDSNNNTVVTNGVATISETAHGLKVGDIVICIDKGSGTLVNETAYTIATVPDVDTFTFFATVDDSTSHTVALMQVQSSGIGYTRMPSPPYAVNFQRRLAMPFKWDVSSGVPTFLNIHDEVILSKTGDTDTYDQFDGNFRLEIGSDDYLVGLHPYSDQQLVALMRDSVHVINVPGELKDATTSVVSTEIGCVARDSVVQVGNQIVFLSDNGVYALDFQDLYNLRGRDVPISQPITDSIDKINKDIWQNSFAVYFDNRYFIAVPSSDSVTQQSTYSGGSTIANTINRILVFNILNQQWETEIFVDSPDFEIDNMIVAGSGEFKQLYIVTKYGAIQYFGSSINLDQVNTSLNNVETLFSKGIFETRDYNFGTTDIKKYNTFETQIENGSIESINFDLKLIVRDIDNTVDLGSFFPNFYKLNVPEGEDLYIRGRLGNPRGYSAKLKFDNFVGRPIIKTIKMSARNTLKSTDTIE